MTDKNLIHDFISKYIGKNLEIMLKPDIPTISGVVLDCDDEFLYLGDSVLSYSLILGIRPINDSPASVKKTKRAEKPKDEKQSDPESEEVKEVKEIKKEINSDQEFEGEIVYFDPLKGKMYGFISCPELKNYDVELQDSEKIFVHLNQISDPDLKEKLLSEKNFKPMIKVKFRLGTNDKGAVADDVRSVEKIVKAPDVLKVDIASALTEEGEIEFFRRYEDVPYGKIRAQGNNLYTFHEDNIIDPVLAVFLECSPSAEGHKVRFSKRNKGKIVEVFNIESAEPFPEERLKAWEQSGMIQKAKERIGGNK